MRRGLAVVLLLVGSCAGTVPAASSAAVVLTEGRIEVDATRFAAGGVTLSIDNSGQFPHTLVVTDAAGGVIAATGLIGPGERTDLAVELAPGSYQFSCRIVSSFEGQVFDHYQMGMMARVEVSAATAAG